MKIEKGKDDHFMDFASGHEAHLFEYVLKHIRNDADLEPVIKDRIAENLLIDEGYGRYYLKVKELYLQGLFNDAFSYENYLAEEGINGTSDHEQPTKNNGDQKQHFLGNLNALRGIAASLTIALAISIFLLVGGKDDFTKPLGADSKRPTASPMLLMEEIAIQHNSELLQESEDAVQCNMHLVFKGFTEEGFSARSKNLNTGREDPLQAELEVRFPDSPSKQQMVAALKKDILDRKFPEYVVQGIYLKPGSSLLSSSTDQGILLVNEARPLAVMDVK